MKNIKQYFMMAIVSMLAAVNTGIAMEKKKKEMPKTALSSKQVAELRKAVEGLKKKPLSESRKEQLIINEYGNKYYTDGPNDDPFVKAKVKEASKVYYMKKYGKEKDMSDLINSINESNDLFMRR